MKLIAILSERDDAVTDKVRTVLKGCTIYPLRTLDKLEEIYNDLPVNLIIIDTITFPLPVINDFLQKVEDDRVVLIVSEEFDKYLLYNSSKSIIDSVTESSIATELPVAVGRALEKQKMQEELRFLKRSTDRGMEAERADRSGNASPEDRSSNDRIVINFARMLTAGFDREKLLDHFIESILEIARVSRMSIMLGDDDRFCIKRQHGLDPFVAENIVLDKESPMVSWLKRTGRILHRPVTFDESESFEISREMELLGSVVSFPMIHNGKLAGIFNLGRKVTAEPLSKGELEIIYILCNYLATAVIDIDLYEQVWFQKEFTNNVISSMTSGLIVVDREKKITVCNHLASEIIGIDDKQILGGDLSALPPQLNNILDNTFDGGAVYKRHEVTIGGSGLPLGVNSFRIVDKDHKTAGAGIIFSDLSDTKKLEEESRKAEKLKVINDLMAMIAHEIRNPMTSIQTYTQLLDEKVKDEELHGFFVSTVSLSIEKLDGLIEKLVSFSNTQEYQFMREEIGGILKDAVAMISKNIPESHKILQGPSDHDFYADVDRKQLIKAFYYIVSGIVERTYEGATVSVSISAEGGNGPYLDVLFSYSGGEPIDKEKEKLIKPLLHIKNLGAELNIPISNKIIEGHNGILDMRSSGDINTFIIKLPLVSKESKAVSSAGGNL